MMLTLLLTLTAWAEDAPCEVVSARDWTSAMNHIDAELSEFKIAVARERVSAAEQMARCVTGVAPPSHVARLAQQMALISFFQQDEENAVRWALAANQAMPNYPWPPDVQEGHPLLRRVAEAEAAAPTGPDRGFAYPKGGGVFWNGRPLKQPKVPDEIPGLLQVADKDGNIVASYWQDGARFREEVLGDDKGDTPRWYKPEDEKAAIANAKQWFEVKGPQRLAAKNKADADRCVLFTEDAFGQVVREHSGDYDRSSADTYTALLKKLARELPCLDAQIPRNGWAQLLVEIAIMEHHQGKAWQQPMQTALATNPRVKIGHAPHEILNWAPPAQGSPGAHLPNDATFVVDGRIVTKVPDLPGLHVVQRFVKGKWETQLLRGEPFPEAWVTETSSSASSASSGGGGGRGNSPVQGTIALLGAFGSANQTPEEAGDWIPDAGTAGAVAGLGTTGRTTLDAPANAFWDVAVPMHISQGLHADAYAGAAVSVLLAGGGMATFPVEIGGEQRTIVLPQPHVGVALPAGPVFLNAGGGWTTAALHGQASATYPVGPMVVGLEAAYARAVFVEAIKNGRELGVSRLRAGLRIGVAFGGD